jgi:hypothetical protein
MVRAILEGRKTQTRRLVNPQPTVQVAGGAFPSLTFEKRRGDGYWLYPNARDEITRECPYGIAGDRLWVREAFRVRRAEPCLEHERDWQELLFPTIRYEADGSEIRFQGSRSTGQCIYRGAVERVKSSIHMPRWASRITLEITEVRVQRLHELSGDDAEAEGIETMREHDENARPTGGVLGLCHYTDGESEWRSRRDAFECLWDSINAKRAPWSSNPWVWAITFRRINP